MGCRVTAAPTAPAPVAQQAPTVAGTCQNLPPVAHVTVTECKVLEPVAPGEWRGVGRAWLRRVTR